MNAPIWQITFWGRLSISPINRYVYVIFLNTSPDVSNSYLSVGCIVIHKHGRCSCADRSDRSYQCSSLTGTTHGRHFFLWLLSFGEVMDRLNARSVRQIHCNVHHASLPSDTFKFVSSVLSLQPILPACRVSFYILIKG